VAVVAGIEIILSTTANVYCFFDVFYSMICRCAGTSSRFWVSSLLALQSVLY